MRRSFLGALVALGVAGGLAWAGRATISDYVVPPSGSVNGASQLVQLDSSAKLPAVDGSALTNVSATTITNGAVQTAKLGTDSVTVGKILNGTITAAKLDATTLFSSAPVNHVCGATIVGALTSGTTFMTFVPDAAITLLRINADVVVAGIAGTGDVIRCNNAAGTGVSVSLTAAAAAGTTATGTGNAAVAYQGQVYCHIDSDAATRPIVNVTLEYRGQ